VHYTEPPTPKKSKPTYSPTELQTAPPTKKAKPTKEPTVHKDGNTAKSPRVPCRATFLRVRLTMTLAREHQGCGRRTVMIVEIGSYMNGLEQLRGKQPTLYTPTL
jgi:hypothetical protein